MTEILLKLLLIVGWSILAVLILGLFLVLFILLVPVRYRITASAEDEISAGVHASWLFKIISFHFDYPSPQAAILKLLGKTIYRSDRPSQNTQQEMSSSPRSDEKKDVPQTDGKTDGNTDRKADEKADQNIEQKADQKINKEVSAESMTDTAAGQPEEKPVPEKLKRKLNKLLTGIRQWKSKISYYLKLASDEETKLLFQHLLMRLCRILKAIRPRSAEGEITIGTGAPDTTGYCLAVYGMIYPYYGNSLKVTADFEEKVLKGHLQITGRITVCKLLYHVLSVLLDKKLYHFIGRFKKGGLNNDR